MSPGDLTITKHAIERYRERKALVDMPDIGLSTEDEIRLLLLFAEPCRCLPESLRRYRARKHGWAAAYWHIGPWRFVIDEKLAMLMTVEPDISPDDAGMWKNISSVSTVFSAFRRGFTIQEITGGKVTFLSHKQV